MSGEHLQPGAHPERLDADAVCVQCGSVNPEGTLICKTCGNNLRDQRLMRLASDQALERGGDVEQQNRWLTGALAIFGLLIVLWTMINIGNIEAWLIQAQSASVSANDDLWYGPTTDEFESLLTEMKAVRFGPGDIQDFMSQDQGEEPVDGVYVVVKQSPLGIKHLATVGVKHVGDELYFVAELREGGELRGIARNTGTAYAADWGSAALFHEGQYSAVAGVAIRQLDGSFECFGQNATTDASYDVLAYRLPDNAAQ
jgi:hypothetical protein